jgi:lysophospholipase L1-like esterase
MRHLRRMTVILVGALGLAMTATAPAAEPDTATTAQATREDIEWLDVWLPQTNDHRLPRVLLIGDSITRGYYPEVEKALAGRASVARLSTSKSLGDPALLKEVALILSEERYEVIHFNNGLHGRGYSEAAYAQALPLVRAVILRYAPGARLIWARTTDLRPSFEGDHPSLARVIERNRLAAQWAAKNDIPVDDLFQIAAHHPEYHAHDGVHFAPEGYAALAAQVSSVISQALTAQSKSN